MSKPVKQVTCALCGQPLPLAQAFSTQAQPVRDARGSLVVSTIYRHRGSCPQTSEVKA